MDIYRHSLIFGLSYALDIAGKNNLSHSKNTAYLSVMIGREMGFDADTILNLNYAALLHDIGLSDTYEITQGSAEEMKNHCVNGEKLLKGLPLPESIAKSVYYHHENYDGSGIFGLSGSAIPEGAQIICFASTFDDIFGKISGEFDLNVYSSVKTWLDEKRSTFSREIINAFENLILREHFLLDYFNIETKYVLSEKLVDGDDECYGYDDIVKYAHCFAGIIDCRSPFTFTHSHGIAELALKATTYLGYDKETQDKMYIAGLLHDVGKLHVLPETLHKDGALTPEERFEINKHTYYTRKILEEIEGFEDIVEYAANHHEKLDGTGYPYHLDGSRMGELEKIMAICDVYQALTEERPYREKLSAEKAWSIVTNLGEKQHLDKTLAAKVQEVFL